jgi:hypothetical protein
MKIWLNGETDGVLQMIQQTKSDNSSKKDIGEMNENDLTIKMH